jgi:hypothetical protein
MNGVFQTSTGNDPGYLGTFDLSLGQWQANAYFNGTMDNVQFFRGYASDQTVGAAFTAFAPDTLTPSYGPNGMDCVNNGTRVDAFPLDRQFTCDCSSTTFAGNPFLQISLNKNK